MKINTKFLNVLLYRSLITFGILFFVRIGTFLPVPFINQNELAFYIQQHSLTKLLINTFAGDNIFVIGLFTLNIFPYINATIFVQLLLGFSPKLMKLQKEGDLESRRAINKLTRSIALILGIIQSIGITFYLKQILFNWNYTLATEIVIWITTGSMIVLWLSELITDYGLGNGTSMLIYTNIISNLPSLFNKVIHENFNNFNLIHTIEICFLILFSLYGIIFLQRGIKKIPLISPKQLNTNSLQTKIKNYLPLRFNQAGVMPIILTTTILVIPNYIINFGIFSGLQPLTSTQPFYWIIYFILVLFSSSFYAYIVLNPKNLSDQLQKMSVTVLNIRPGLQTTFYLQQTIQRITIIGAFFLAILTVLPNFMESILGTTSLNGLNITSLLILAGVILDILREIDNIYYSNIYNNKY